MTRHTKSPPHSLLTLLALVFWLAVALITITTPLDLSSQIVFGLACGVLLLIVSRKKSHWSHIAMLLMCIMVSSRYLYWRATDTLVFDTFLEAFLGIGLLLAEVYAWLILTLGFFQTIWPLDRKIVPLPEDVSTWPTVDVYIPTYNESLDVVKDTVLAAQNMDYPPDKVKIYLLDDGRRAEFGAFAAAAGVGYLTRDNNNHAKAGNLNNAIGLTDGELICIFDCDHVATRVFLQSTLGAFVRDPNLALLQTPHYFYSPDPFERNLTTGNELSGEGEFFYGPVQKGNDFWNAAFFCGSCAVLRRTAIEEIGGFAVETVTEDAHTALRLQREGWGSAFLAIPLAAGLATERLALHIGQRARWARGMIQIFRLDNPLFGKGLALAQRLCYLNAVMHFLFALPRIVFLTAPLCYLLFGQNIIDAPLSMILAYALPHLLFVMYTNARLQGQFRQTFWGEIYETVLSFHLVLPTLATLWNPRKGKFNVTEKGGLLANDYFDYNIVKPHLVTLFFLFLGILVGVVQFIWSDHYNLERKVLLLNLVWASFSALMLMAAIAVAREMKQIRKTVRFNLPLPALLHLDSGHLLQSKTINVSMGGAQVESVMLSSPDEKIEYLELVSKDTTLFLEVETIARSEESIRFRFTNLPLARRKELVNVVMGRADAWLPEKKKVHSNNVFRAIYRVLRSITGLFKKKTQKRGAETELHQVKPWRTTVFFVAMLLLGALLVSQKVLSAPMTAKSVESEVGNVAGANRENNTELYSFKDLGVHKQIYFYGNNSASGLDFKFRNDEFVRSATLKLHLSHSEALLEDESFLELVLNGQLLKKIELSPFTAKASEVEIVLEPALLLSRNNLGFILRGRTVQECSNELSKDIWVAIHNDSLLSVVTQRLPVSADLALYPEPFFTPGAMNKVVVPIVLPSNATAAVLASGAIVTSHLGHLAQYSHISFPVLRNKIPLENAIVFVTSNDSVPGLPTLRIEGPELKLINNPLSPLYKLLLVMGRSAEELKTAASYLATHQSQLAGPSVLAEKIVRESREVYDVPRWINSKQPVYFSEYLQEPELVSKGLFHPPIEFSFRASPDLNFGSKGSIPMQLRYNFPEGDWLDEDRSVLNVSLNGHFLAALPVNKKGLWSTVGGWFGRDRRQEEATIKVPPYLLYGENKLEFHHDFVVNTKGCELNVPTDVTARIAGDSSIDLSVANHFTKLPNLSYFVGVGYPFSRQASLSETVVLLPEKAGSKEIEALFELAARLGRDTGAPSVGLTVKQGLAYTEDMSGHDVIVIANVHDLQTSSVLKHSPFEVVRSRMQVKSVHAIHRFGWFLQGDWQRDTKGGARLLDNTQNVQGLFSFISPLNPERIVVVLAAERSEQLPLLVQALNQPLVSSEVQGDLSLIHSTGRVQSTRVGGIVAVGDMSWSMRIGWFFSQHIMLMVIGIALAAFLGTAILFPLLSNRAARRLNQGAGKRE